MKRVLLVDNHNLFRQVLAATLKQRTDFKQNAQAGSLAEAHQILADLDVVVDLAVVDLDLPEEGAIDLIQKLHELDVPVLAFTGVQNLKRRTWALRVRAIDVLSTASSDEDIVGVVNRLIGE